MKKLNVNLAQSFVQNGSQKENNVNIVVNVLDSDTKFSAKVLRKLIQRGVNNVLEIPKVGISKGRRFTMHAEFEGVTLSSYETFYNSNQSIQANFNKLLRARLNALVMDIADVMQAQRSEVKKAEKVA